MKSTNPEDDCPLPLDEVVMRDRVSSLDLAWEDANRNAEYGISWAEWIASNNDEWETLKKS